MAAFHQQYQPIVTLASHSKKKVPGIFCLDEKDELCGWKNSKNNEDESPGKNNRCFKGI